VTAGTTEGIAGRTAATGGSETPAHTVA